MGRQHGAPARPGDRLQPGVPIGARDEIRDVGNPLYYGPIRRIMVGLAALYLVWQKMTCWAFYRGINLPRYGVTTGKDDPYKNS